MMARLLLGIGLGALVLMGAWYWRASTTAATPPPPTIDTLPATLTQFDSSAAQVVFAGRGPGHWDETIRERGWIMRNPDGYRLWYSAYSGPRSSIKLLGHATSQDGRNWQRDPAPLVSDQWIEDIMVVIQDGTYYMFAEGVGDQAQLWRSKDGLDWQRVGKIDLRQTNGEPIAAGSYGTPTALYEDGVWYLFYERQDLGIWVARSTDLEVWTNLSDDPVLLPGPDAYDARLIAVNQVIKRGDQYYAYYHGTGSTSKPSQWCTAVAVSTDLLVWHKYAGNPILPCDPNSASGILVTLGDEGAFFTMHNEVRRHLPQRAALDSPVSDADRPETSLPPAAHHAD